LNHGRRATRTVKGHNRHFRRAGADCRSALLRRYSGCAARGRDRRAESGRPQSRRHHGALEIPAAIAIAIEAAEKAGKPYDAAIALGCVIRGNTIHFEIVSQESSRALMDLAVSKKFPLGNGIVTVNTEAQAWARARASELNKGGDAARAAIAMLRIKRRLAKNA
jgi:6,7-dimethyl-8-ribityllumazine synthase